MFRMWAKIFKNNHMLKDTCIEDGSDDTRTHKVFHSLDEVCHQFDLGTPIWLDMNIADFKRHNKTRFTQDSFVESIDFDYLEIQIIEYLWLTVWYRETECFWKCGSLIRLPRSFLLPFYGCICSCFTP